MEIFEGFPFVVYFFGMVSGWWLCSLRRTT